MAALAAIFDLDGTLLDTLGDLTAAVNYALGELSCPRRTREEVRSFIGNGVPTLLRRSLPAGADEEMHRQAMALFSAYYGENMTKTTAPYPGIPWLLERLSEDGVRLGVVSNKKHDATQPLCRRFFGALLGCALGARDDSERKPNPSMLLRAIECWGPTRRTPSISATPMWIYRPLKRPVFPAVRSAGDIGRLRFCVRTARRKSLKRPRRCTTG